MSTLKRLILAVALFATVAAPTDAQWRRVRRRVLTANSYTTNFQTVENPLLTGGIWLNGLQNGLDWTDIRVSGGVAYGTRNGGVAPPYSDSVALLTGTWANDQTLTATVYTTNQNATAYEEVELWCRSSVAQHSMKGYETNARVTSDGSEYVGIVIWNGVLNDYTQIGSNCTGFGGLHNGDTFKVTCLSNVITAYINNVQVCQRTDAGNVYPSGNPGIGHWYRINGAVGTAASDYGLTSLTVTAQ